jgi:hypothetical protein
MTPLQRFWIDCFATMATPGWVRSDFRSEHESLGESFYRATLERGSCRVKVDAWPSALSYWLDQRRSAAATFELIDYGSVAECSAALAEALGDVLAELVRNGTCP